MFIEVEPRVKLKLADLRVNKRSLISFNPSAPVNRGLKGYRSSDGLVMSLFKDRILQIVYFADESDRHHQCSNYYQHPESFVEVINAHVPVIYKVDDPVSIKAGERLKVSAYSSMNETRGYTWNLSAGRIVAGQYTKQITVDTTGLAGQKIVISAEIADAFGHVATASYMVEILPN